MLSHLRERFFIFATQENMIYRKCPIMSLECNGEDGSDNSSYESELGCDARSSRGICGLGTATCPAGRRVRVGATAGSRGSRTGCSSLDEGENVRKSLRVNREDTHVHRRVQDGASVCLAVGRGGCARGIGHGGDGSERLRGLSVGLGDTSSIGEYTGEVLVLRVAACELIRGVGSRRVVGATDTIEDVLAIPIILSTCGVASFEAEGASSDEAGKIALLGLRKNG
jgi:hypothetical protein